MKEITNLKEAPISGYYFVKSRLPYTFRFSFTVTPDTYKEIYKDTVGNQFEFLDEVIDSNDFRVYEFDSRKEYENYISKKNLAEKFVK